MTDSSCSNTNRAIKGLFALYVWERFRRHVAEAKTAFVEKNDLEAFERDMNRAMEALRQAMMDSGLRDEARIAPILDEFEEPRKARSDLAHILRDPG